VGGGDGRCEAVRAGSQCHVGVICGLRVKRWSDVRQEVKSGLTARHKADAGLCPGPHAAKAELGREQELRAEKVGVDKVHHVRFLRRTESFYILVRVGV
jgi:hypothetical protein